MRHAPSNKGDWERYVAFIRLDFPPSQRDIAQRLAAMFGCFVGKEIAKLRPEHTLEAILTWGGADSLDTVEFVMTLEEDFGFEMDDKFAKDWSKRTFRDLVEHLS